MVLKAFCDKCGIQLADGPESNPIDVNVDDVTYYSGHLCKEHWKELLVIIDSFKLCGGSEQTVMEEKE